MTEKGFATIFGLCLILVIALIVKGIQESEMNHAYETTDFQTEFDLQSAADSGIYAAAEIVRQNPDILPVNENPYFNGSRQECQKQLIPPKDDDEDESSDKNITVEVWGERISLQHYNVKYNAEDENGNNKNIATPLNDEEVYIFFSKAKIDSKRTDEKIYRLTPAYRRASAYILVNDADMKIHFMELPTRNYKKN